MRCKAKMLLIESSSGMVKPYTLHLLDVSDEYKNTPANEKLNCYAFIVCEYRLTPYRQELFEILS